MGLTISDEDGRNERELRAIMPRAYPDITRDLNAERVGLLDTPEVTWPPRLVRLRALIAELTPSPRPPLTIDRELIPTRRQMIEHASDAERPALLARIEALSDEIAAGEAARLATLVISEAERRLALLRPAPPPPFSYETLTSAQIQLVFTLTDYFADLQVRQACVYMLRAPAERSAYTEEVSRRDIARWVERFRNAHKHFVTLFPAALFPSEASEE